MHGNLDNREALGLMTRVNTDALFPHRPINSKFTDASDGELIEELRDRRAGYLEYLGSVVDSFATTAVPPKTPVAAPARTKHVAAKATKAPKSATPRSEAAAASEGMSLNERILQALSSLGPLRTRDLLVVLTEGGWTTKAAVPSKAIATAVSDLVTKKVLKRTPEGTLVVAKKSSPAPSVKRNAKKASKAKTKAAPKKTGKNTRPADGKRTEDYVLAALAETGGSSTVKDVLVAVQKAGWQSTSSNPTKVVDTNLRDLAREGKVIALGKGQFQLAGQ
jgi:hypothetical protein